MNIIKNTASQFAHEANQRFNSAKATGKHIKNMFESNTNGRIMTPQFKKYAVGTVVITSLILPFNQFAAAVAGAVGLSVGLYNRFCEAINTTDNYISINELINNEEEVEDAPQGMHPSSNLDNLADTDNNRMNINAMSFDGDMFELGDDDDDCSTSHMGHKENPASQLSLTPSVSSLNTEGARTPKAATDPAKQTISEDIKPMTDQLENLNVMPNNQAENQMKNSGERDSLSGFNARSIDTTDIDNDNDTSSETINNEIALLKQTQQEYLLQLKELHKTVDDQRLQITSELNEYHAMAKACEQSIQDAKARLEDLHTQLIENNKQLAEHKKTQAKAEEKSLLGIEEESKETQDLELRIKNINLDIEDRERLIAYQQKQKDFGKQTNENINCAKEELIKNEANLASLQRQISKNIQKTDRLEEELKDNKQK